VSNVASGLLAFWSKRFVSVAKPTLGVSHYVATTGINVSVRQN
jgi:hypothetical protein